MKVTRKPGKKRPRTCAQEHLAHIIHDTPTASLLLSQDPLGQTGVGEAGHRDEQVETTLPSTLNGVRFLVPFALSDHLRLWKVLTTAPSPPSPLGRKQR